MTKYHIKADGTPGVCRATKGNCPLGGAENHFDTPEAAEAASQERMEQSAGLGFSSGNPSLQSEESFKDKMTEILIDNESENADTVYQFEGENSYGEPATIETSVVCDEEDDSGSAEGLEIEVTRRTDEGDSESDTYHVSVSDAYKIARGKKPVGDVSPEAKKAVQAFSENHGMYEGKPVDWEFGA